MKTISVRAHRSKATRVKSGRASSLLIPSRPRNGILKRAALGVMVLALVASALGQSRTGIVHFDNSGAPAAQADFQTGLTQLHNFQYEQAEKLFQKAEVADPNFAMAYWGEALTHVHPLWNYEDLDGARKVLLKLAPTAEERIAKAKTPREKEYFRSIETLFGEGDRDTRNARYSDALAQVHEHYPKDVDAAALYALSLLGKQLKRDPALYMRAAAVLEDYFPTNQQHPGVVHYLIHSYDDPVHAPLGMRAARLYGNIAPDSGHAQHMTSHIFIAMGMWPEVIHANLEALATSTRLSEAGAEFAAVCNHASSWLLYGYLQTGEVEKAHDVVANCVPKTLAAPPDRTAYGYAQEMTAHYVIGAQKWNDPLLQQMAAPDKFPRALATYWYIHAIAAANRGDMDEAQKDYDALKKTHEAIVVEMKRAVHPNSAIEQYAAVEERQVEATLLLARGDQSGALELLKQTMKMETEIPFEFGPPEVPKPTAEMYAELLMKMNKAADAMAVLHEQLSRTPGRTATLSDLRDAAKMAGDAVAQKSADDLLATNLRQQTK